MFVLAFGRSEVGGERERGGTSQSCSHTMCGELPTLDRSRQPAHLPHHPQCRAISKCVAPSRTSRRDGDPAF